MATRIIHEIVDDLDEKLTATKKARLSFNGRAVELDLNDKHYQELETVLERFLGAGRRVVGTAATAVEAAGKRTSGAAMSAAARKELNTKIRAWAKTEKKELAERGRIPFEIVQEYHNRFKMKPAAEEATPLFMGPPSSAKEEAKPVPPAPRQRTASAPKKAPARKTTVAKKAPAKASRR